MQSERAVSELLAEQERERRRAGEEVDEAAELAEDFLGVRPLLEKLERRKAKEAAKPPPDDSFWEPTDSDSDEDDERFSADSVRRRAKVGPTKTFPHVGLGIRFPRTDRFGFSDL